MENLMSLQPYIRQLRPRNESYIPPIDKVQSLHEAEMTPKELIKYGGIRAGVLKKAIEDNTPLETDKGTFPLTWIDDSDRKMFDDAVKKGGDGNYDFLKKGGKFKPIFKNTAGEEFNLKLLVKSAMFGGKGSSGEPSGADWENIITMHFNELVGQFNHDKNANEGAAKFPDYDDMGETLAKNIVKRIGKSPITQFGAGKSKSNLSSFWISYGGSDGTPKTDMYNDEYNISLKKKGGSQLASGGQGETMATFHAALEYLGAERADSPEIDRIMKQIEENFLKLSTKYSKGQLDTIAQNTDKQKDLSPEDKKVLADFVTTEEFHKDLNEEIQKHLTFEKQPEFLKWYTYEAMSGVKKFSIQRGKASVCLEFDANNGAVSKFIEVTQGGKSKGLSGTPSVSSDVIGISKKVKVYAAWKSSGGNPYSTLRLGLSTDYTTPDTTYTLQGIIRNEVMNDKVANAVLKEEITQLDEFRIIGQTLKKLKGLGTKAVSWFKNLIGKIMKKVKQTLSKIKKLGAKMFETLFKFLGMVVSKVRESIPRDVAGFVYGMAD